jgi:hypothetical protein
MGLNNPKAAQKSRLFFTRIIHLSPDIFSCQLNKPALEFGAQVLMGSSVKSHFLMI